MANQLFKAGRAAFAAGSVNWLGNAPGGTVVPYVMGSFDPALVGNAVFLSDIPAAVWRARGTYLTGRTVASGICDADDTTIVNVGSAGSATAHNLVLVSETGASQTSLLIHNADVASVLPFLPNGGDLSLVFDNGANRIFVL